LAACTSATPPADAAGSTKEAVPAAVPAPEVTAAPLCELGATRPCYSGPPSTEGVGRCKAGVERCEGMAWSGCTDAVAPAAEEDCRTPHDEDCDGRSDDCPAAEVALAIAFTRDRALWLEDWGGGLGVVDGAIFWVVEPGGRVIDPWEDADPTERDPESGEEQTMVTGGAWPGALVRSYETGGTRAGYIMVQERWDGSQFSGEESSDEHLQWRYEDAVPWRDGHAIAVRHTYQSYEAMEQLDASTLEYGTITAVEQRALARKVARLLGKAKPRLEILAAGDVVAWEPAYGVFEAMREQDAGEGEEGEGEGEEDEGEGTDPEPPAPLGNDEATSVADEADAAPELPQPPKLPGELQSFVVLTDGMIAMLGREGIWTWKPGQRRWSVVEPPPGFTVAARKVSLHAGPGGELLVRDCDQQQALGALWRRTGSVWVDVGLPTSACPMSLAVAPDHTRWMITDERLWRRRAGEGEPWSLVPLPRPWSVRQVMVFDEAVWIAAEAEGGKWAVLVDRPVPTPHVLRPQ